MRPADLPSASSDGSVPARPPHGGEAPDGHFLPRRSQSQPGSRTASASARGVSSLQPPASAPFTKAPWRAPHPAYKGDRWPQEKLAGRGLHAAPAPPPKKHQGLKIKKLPDPTSPFLPFTPRRKPRPICSFQATSLTPPVAAYACHSRPDPRSQSFLDSEPGKVPTVTAYPREKPDSLEPRRPENSTAPRDSYPNRRAPGAETGMEKHISETRFCSGNGNMVWEQRANDRSLGEMGCPASEPHGDTQISCCICTILPTFSTKGNSHSLEGPALESACATPPSESPASPPSSSSFIPVSAKCGNSKEPCQETTHSALAFPEKQD